MRVGIIGAGLMGARRAKVLTVAGDTLQVVADVDEARARTVAAETGARVTAVWQEAVTAPDVDACIVAMPPKHAVPVSLAAAQHGKHVLCEKPLGRTPAEEAGLVEAARRAGVVLKTGFNHRHHPAMERAHRLIADGGLDLHPVARFHDVGVCDNDHCRRVDAGCLVAGIRFRPVWPKALCLSFLIGRRSAISSFVETNLHVVQGRSGRLCSRGLT